MEDPGSTTTTASSSASSSAHKHPATEAAAAAAAAPATPLPPPSVVNLSHDCANIIALYLDGMGRHLVPLTSESRAGALTYRPCIRQVTITDRNISGYSTGNEPALVSLVEKLTALEHVAISQVRESSAALVPTVLRVLRENGGSKQLRSLQITLVGWMETPGLQQLLATLGAMVAAGELPALRELRLAHRRRPQLLEAYVALSNALLAHANAPVGFACLDFQGPANGSAAALALAAALEARAARGLPGLAELEAGDWFEHCEAAERILRVCMPTLRCLGGREETIDHQPTREVLVRAFDAAPAESKLEKLGLVAKLPSDATAFAAVLRHKSFPALEELRLKDFKFGPPALHDLVAALRHGLPRLRRLWLTDCSTEGLYPGMDALLGALEEGGGACLREIILDGYVTVTFKERLVQAIRAGACPMLERAYYFENSAARAALEERRRAQREA